ncbi:MAG: cation:dicarboxylase symporter family transporter, partial [Fulvivirga sp.]
MKNLPLHTKIIIGLVAGVIWAFLSSYLGWNEFTINWIDPFGTIFIRLLKYIAVPLVLFSIISGVSSLTDVSKLGRLGGKTLALYLTTTVIAIGIGLVLVNVVKPGTFLDEDQRIKNRISYEKWVQDTPGVPQPKDGRNFLNDPELRSKVEEVISQKDLDKMDAKNEIVAKRQAAAEQTKEQGPLQFFVDIVPENIILAISDNGLMLQVIFFAIFF